MKVPTFAKTYFVLGNRTICAAVVPKSLGRLDYLFVGSNCFFMRNKLKGILGHKVAHFNVHGFQPFFLSTEFIHGILFVLSSDWTLAAHAKG